MEERDIVTIEQKDFIHATANMMATNEHINELLHEVPTMALIIPILASELWDELVKHSRMKTVAKTIDDMLNDKEDN